MSTKQWRRKWNMKAQVQWKVDEALLSDASKPVWSTLVFSKEWPSFSTTCIEKPINKKAITFTREKISFTIKIAFERYQNNKLIPKYNFKNKSNIKTKTRWHTSRGRETESKDLQSSKYPLLGLDMFTLLSKSSLPSASVKSSTHLTSEPSNNLSGANCAGVCQQTISTRDSF